ncbi:hypothetical protein KJ780_03315 [Candidatus Micrarchaeota archaeon]|nr:hypothetical protein [Candidatus Micrarchaeota archaeon]
MINNAWKSTCKVLFGEELGELKDFEGYLEKNVQKLINATCAISGKEVTATKGYPPNARFISYGIPEYEKIYLELNVNEIKDIDSLFGAIKERAYYSGNNILGNCKDVVRTNKALESFYVDGCEIVFRGKYIYGSEMVRDCEYVFGCSQTAEDKFQIMTCETWRNQRIFESIRTYLSSDCYYCANVESSQNCMFCFNLRNKRYCIGNLELSVDKYSALKKKLVNEMAQELKGKKRISSIIDVIQGGENE